MRAHRHTAHVTVMWVEIADLEQAPIAAGRHHLDRERVSHHAAHFDEAPPVVVFDTGDDLLLADGYHRVAAAQQLGHESVWADVRKGTRSDALAFAVAVGRRQRGLTDDQVLEAIRRRGDASTT